MSDSHTEGQYSVFVDHGDPMAERHRRIDHLIAQHKESAKYEDPVLDYNMIPLKDQLHKQAQIPAVNIQQQSEVAKQNQAKEKILELSTNTERFCNYTKRLDYQMYLRDQILTLLLIALVLLIGIYYL